MNEDEKNERPVATSICQVAAKARVSAATVSRVINNDPRISLKTARIVRAAMSDLRYEAAPVNWRRGPRQRGRRPVRRQQVGLLFGNNPMLLSTPVYSLFIHSIEQRLQEDGWSLVVRHLPVERSWEAIPHRLDGVFLLGVPGAFSIPRLQRELLKRASVLLMGPVVEEELFDHVTYDERKIGPLVAAWLMEKGHRNLAAIGMPGLRIDDFVASGRAAGAEVRALVRRDLLNETGRSQVPNATAMRAAAQWLMAETPRPTGVYVPADILAVGLYPALIRCGLAPGSDIDIVGTNNDEPLLGCLSPRPASVDIHVEQIGRRAVEQLYWRLDHPREPRQLIQLDPTMVPGSGAGGI